MSLANTLAVCQAAGSLVLLGDPRQLDQPIQGVHPPGADVSALGHLLGESATVDPSRGVFLDQTWRMHPDTCAFTTEQFYEGRLRPQPALRRQTVAGPGPLAGHGLCFIPVEHAGNTNASAEESECVAALIQGVNAEVRNAIVSQFGPDSFGIDRTPVVLPEADIEAVRNNPRLSLDDADAIRRFSPSVRAVMAQSGQSGEVRYRDRVLESVSIRGVTRDYVEFPIFTAERGRLLSRTEVARNRGVALLGAEAADRLFDQLDPIDRRIKIQGVNFRVVGVSEPTLSLFGQSQDEFAVIPMGQFRKLFGARPSLILRVRSDTPEEFDRAVDEATVALRIERQLRATEENDFGLFTPGSARGLYQQATAGIFAVLVGIVSLSLVVGGIVIMNIMLMVVSERTREIGLRKAMGARRRDLLWQILAESVILSVSGGLIGTALGFAVAIGLSSLTPITAAVHPWSVVLGISMAAVVGLFFGLYPASRAAALDPITALSRA